MRKIAGVVLLIGILSITGFGGQYGERTRTGGAVDIIKAKIFIFYGLSEMIGVLGDAAADVKGAQSAQELSDIVMYAGKKFKDIIGLMKKTAQPYEKILNKDKEFTDAGKTLVEDMMDAFTGFQAAVVKWREGKTLSPEEEKILLDAVKYMSSFEDE